MGSVSGILAAAVLLFDIVYGSAGIDKLPATADAIFSHFKKGLFSGLYHLDFINAVLCTVSLPLYFSLALIHKKQGHDTALLAAALYFCGTAVFLACNSALPMAELSNRYSGAASAGESNMILAAAEAVLVKGRHSGPGIFPAMLLQSSGSILISFIMLKSRIIGRKTALAGVIGNPLLLVYVFLVSFFPETGSIAMIFALPGGLLNLAWMTGIIVSLINMYIKNFAGIKHK